MQCDPDPRIRITDLRTRILLFSSVADKMTKTSFFSKFCLLLFEGTSSKIISKKSQNSRNQGFSYFFVVDGRIRSREDQKHTDHTDPDPDPQHCGKCVGLSEHLSLNICKSRCKVISFVLVYILLSYPYVYSNYCTEYIFQ